MNPCVLNAPDQSCFDLDLSPRCVLQAEQNRARNQERPLSPHLLSLLRCFEIVKNLPPYFWVCCVSRCASLHMYIGASSGQHPVGLHMIGGGRLAYDGARTQQVSHGWLRTHRCAHTVQIHRVIGLHDLHTNPAHMLHRSISNHKPIKGINKMNWH